MNRPRADLTMLIEATRKGDREAHDQLFSLVYEELRGFAARSPYVGQAGDTMQPTVLANEAYLLFARRFPLPPQDQRESRATFFRTVALAMRTILRDHWRTRQAAKRGAGRPPMTLGDHQLSDECAESDFDVVDFLALDQALDHLERYNARWCDVVMHRYFAGRTVEETADLMGTGVTKVKKDWKLAKAWLQRELGGNPQ